MNAAKKESKLNSRLKGAAYITALIFLVELVGGYLTNSLALLSDSAHVFMDVMALGLSYFAHKISCEPPTEKRTYGLHRFEVFASLINGISLIFICLFIFYKAAGRIIDPPEVESVGMLIVATIGLVVNVVVALYLKVFTKTDLNVRSAYLHVIGDAAASVGVIAGAIIIYYTGYKIVDPLISLLVGAIIIKSAISIVREASGVLLEGVPSGLRLREIVDDILAIEGVEGVHSLHVWSICYNVFALSAHIDVTGKYKGKEGDVVAAINEKLAETHLIFYTTIQPECCGCETKELFRKIEHLGDDPHGGHGHNHAH